MLRINSAAGARPSAFHLGAGIILKGLLAALLWASPALAASTINPANPQQGLPYSPAPIRLNFDAAANDINALQSMNAGPSAPSSPTAGYLWLNTPQSATVYNLNVWDGAAWLPVASLDAANHIWMPPVGGGIPPSLLSAATTDLGSVPEAAVIITGSNTIASFGASAPIGAMKFLTFSATPTIVYNSVSLVIPGSQTITVGAGDTMIVQQFAAGDWRVFAYQPASSISPNCFAGPTAPPSPKLGTCWENTTTSPIVVSEVYDGSTWVVFGSIDTTNHIWQNPIAGGVEQDIASAATTDLGSVPGANVTVTGTTTITSFGSSAITGTDKIVTFQSPLTVDDSSAIVIPGGANATVAASDVWMVKYLGGGNWRVLATWPVASGYITGIPPTTIGDVMIWDNAAASLATGYPQLHWDTINHSLNISGNEPGLMPEGGMRQSATNGPDFLEFDFGTLKSGIVFRSGVVTATNTGEMAQFNMMRLDEAQFGVSTPVGEVDFGTSPDNAGVMTKWCFGQGIAQSGGPTPGTSGGTPGDDGQINFYCTQNGLLTQVGIFDGNWGLRLPLNNQQATYTALTAPSVSGTTSETNLGTAMVADTNAMLPNSCVEVYAVVNASGTSPLSDEVVIRESASAGATSGTKFFDTAVAPGGNNQPIKATICNSGSITAQVAAPLNGAISGAIVTGAINTFNPVYININVIPAATTDTDTLYVFTWKFLP